jgi:hypothetical protein
MQIRLHIVAPEERWEKVSVKSSGLGRPPVDDDFVATPYEIPQRMLPPQTKDRKHLCGIAR